MGYNIFDPFILFIIYLHFSLDTLKSDRFTDERRRELEKHEEHLQDDEEVFSKSQEVQMKQQEIALVRDIKWMFKYNGISITHMLIYSSYVINLVIFFLITGIYGVFSHSREPETQKYISPVLRFLESYYVMDIFGKYNNSRRFNLALSFNLFIAILNKWIYCREHIRRARTNRYQYKDLSIVQSTVNYMRTLNLNTNEWINLTNQAFKHDCDADSSFKFHRSNLEHRMMFKLGKIDRLYFHNMIDFSSCFKDWQSHDKNGEDLYRKGFINRLARYLKPDDNKYFVPEPKYRIDIKDLSLLVISYILSVILATTTILIGNYSFWHLAFVEAAVSGVSLEENTPPKIEWMVSNLLMTISGTECGTILLTGIFCYSRIKQISRLIENELQVQRIYLKQFINFLDHTEAKVFEFLTNDSSVRTTILSDLHFMRLRKKFKEQINPIELIRLNENLNYIVILIGVLKDELGDFKRAYTLVMNIITIFGLASTTIILTTFRMSITWSEILIALPLVLLSAVPIIFCLITSAMVESAFRDVVKRIGFLIGDGLNLIDANVNLRINSIYKHLSHLHNRSFILFANFPLSFSSLLTISAWICSVYQAMAEQGMI